MDVATLSPWYVAINGNHVYIVDNCISTDSEGRIAQVADKDDAQKIVLMHNARIVMMRRKWFAVPCPAGWVAARLFPDVQKDNSAEWTWAIPHVIPCEDPETAILEAEKWALANPEAFKQYDDWQNNVKKEHDAATNP